MASNLQLYSGSPLIGSPIVYRCTAASPTGDVTFQRLKLKVHAGLSSEGVYYDFEFSRPVQKGATVEFDISSALIAVAEKYEYTAEPPVHYPYIAFNLEACDEYMRNGQNSGDVGIVTNPGGRALMGAFSDMERLRASQSGRTTSRFSRKPSTTPEIVIVGETYVRAEPMTVTIGNISNGPKVFESVFTSAGSHSFYVGTERVNVYAVAASQDRYQLRFINGLGCMESIAVQCLVNGEMQIKSDDYVIARQELFNTVSRSAVVKQNDREVWKMSSGPLDRAWQSWFLHELIPASQVWIHIDDMWVPCQIIPEETVKSFNRQTAAPLEVQFSVRLDINGSPMAALAV